MDLEWRDFERIIAIVFSDFGYNVELTLSAKDGGKDVIVWYKGESYPLMTGTGCNGKPLYIFVLHDQ